MLSRSAEINDCWRVLKDRWQRARALIGLRAPDLLDQHRQLGQEFLLEAMELAEQVATCEPAELPALRQKLAAAEDDAFAAIQGAVIAGDFALAARRLHESKYVRKALADLLIRTGLPA